MTDKPDQTSSPRSGSKRAGASPSRMEETTPILPENALDAPTPEGGGASPTVAGGAADVSKTDLSETAPFKPDIAKPAGEKTDSGKPRDPEPSPTLAETVVTPADDAPVTARTSVPPARSQESLRGQEVPRGDPPAPHARSGSGGLIAAVLLGGVAGFGGAALYEIMFRPSPDTRLAALERRIETPPPQIAALEQRLGRVESGAQETRGVADKALAQSAKSAAAPSVEPAALDALSKRVATIEGLTGRIDGIEKAAQSRQQAVADLDGRLAALSKTVADNAEAATVRASLRLTLADRVLASLRNGQPYPRALEALKGLGAAPEKLGALSPFAESGAPGGAALLREFRAALPKAEPAAAPAQAARDEGDWKGRLLGLADKIVTVTPVTPQGPPPRSDAVARVETALERGALQEAVTAWDVLPDATRKATESFGAKLKQRLAAEQAAADLSSEALATVETAVR